MAEHCIFSLAHPHLPRVHGLELGASMGTGREWRALGGKVQLERVSVSLMLKYLREIILLSFTGFSSHPLGPVAFRLVVGLFTWLQHVVGAVYLTAARKQRV